MRGSGVLQIEPTDFCNLHCPMCHPHAEGAGNVHGATPRGFMDFDLFRAVIDGIARDGVEFDHLILQWLGEPTLHPRLFDMLCYALRRAHASFGYFRFDTNALAWRPENTAALLTAMRDHPGRPVLVVFSLDAASPETYRRVKGADAFAQVEANILGLMEARRALDPALHPLNLQFQFVLQEGNAAETRAFVEKWEAAVESHGPPRFYDEIMIKRLAVGTGGAEQERADALYDRTLAEQRISSFSRGTLVLKTWERVPWTRPEGEEPRPPSEGAGGAPEAREPAPRTKTRPPCPGVWWTPVVRWDGTLLLCCVDTAGEAPLGNLREHSFRELWEGERATRIRLDHIAGELDRVPTCARCAGINFYELGPGDVRRYLASVGRSDLWPAYASRMGLTPEEGAAAPPPGGPPG